MVVLVVLEVVVAIVPMEVAAGGEGDRACAGGCVVDGEADDCGDCAGDRDGSDGDGSI